MSVPVNTCNFSYDELTYVNQQFYTDKCGSVALDNEYIKKVGSSNIETRTLKCNIPGINNTSTIITYSYKDKDNNNIICPVGGWCINSNNIGGVIDTEKSEITSQFELTNVFDVKTNLCPVIPIPGMPPPVIPSESPIVPSESPIVPSESPIVPSESPIVPSESPIVPSASPSALPSVSPEDITSPSSICETPLVELNYNNDCNLIKQDNLMIRSFCGANNENSTIDSEGITYCKKDDYKLYLNIDNNIKCENGVNTGSHPVFKLIDPSNNSILCPKGYCNDSNGNINNNNINKYLVNAEKHPFCN